MSAAAVIFWLIGLASLAAPVLALTSPQRGQGAPSAPVVSPTPIRPALPGRVTRAEAHRAAAEFRASVAAQTGVRAAFATLTLPGGTDELGH